MRKLTTTQAENLRGALVASGTPVRFLFQGCAYNIQTGTKAPRGSNVMNQPVYWCFSKETAKEVAKLTNTKAVFSD